MRMKRILLAGIMVATLLSGCGKTESDVVNTGVTKKIGEKKKENMTEKNTNSHGFGEGTVAKGWIDNADAFWENNIK